MLEVLSLLFPTHFLHNLKMFMMSASYLIPSVTGVKMLLSKQLSKSLLKLGNQGIFQPNEAILLLSLLPPGFFLSHTDPAQDDSPRTTMT